MAGSLELFEVLRHRKVEEAPPGNSGSKGKASLLAEVQSFLF